MLEDASGRRLRRMRWVGRAVALFFLVWLAIVILGGLGVGPAAHVPFGNVLRPSAGPPPLPHVLHPRKAAPADLVPAAAAAAAATHGRSNSTPAGTKTGQANGRSGSAPGHSKTPTTTSPGRSGTAPGHTKQTTTRGRSATAPGKTKTSATAPGKTKTVVTTTNRAGKSHVAGKKP